jgi:hypothetical protein
MGKRKARSLNLKAVRYCLINQVFHWRDPLGVFLRCLNPQEAQKVMFDFHSGLLEGIISGIPQPTKFSGLGTTGPPYSLMSAKKSDLASNTKGSQESNNSNLCH